MNGNEKELFPTFSLIIRGMRDMAGMELPGIELRPELPRAIPITVRRDDGVYLVGLRFKTVAEAEKFAEGLAEFCDRDGEQLFLKRPPAINRDERGNCSGVN